jgi:hypothetical protein
MAQRVLLFLLFLMYIITAVRLCRYSSWRRNGAPNPFLPRRMKAMLRAHAKHQMSRGQMPVFG